MNSRSGLQGCRTGHYSLCKQAIELFFDTDETDAVKQTLALSDEVFQAQDVAEGIRGLCQGKAKIPASVTARTPAESHAALDFVLAPQLSLTTTTVPSVAS